MDTIGRPIPNTSMLAAVVKISGVIPEDVFLEKMETSFKHLFATKPQGIAGNMEALKRSMQEVKVL
jgi:pyruvate ferredoxin oxidoreductase gamma subunit